MEEKRDQYVEIDIMEILALLKANIVYIILVTVIFGLAGFFWTEYLITPQYEASVNMIVNTRVDTSTTVSNDNINSAKSLVSTYAIIIMSVVFFFLGRKYEGATYKKAYEEYGDDDDDKPLFGGYDN